MASKDAPESRISKRGNVSPIMLGVFFCASALARTLEFAMTRSMRTVPILACLALTISNARSESLSSADREALLASLEALREAAISKVDARFRLAMTAYRDAMVSGDAAMDFYLKCIEKVNFDDQQKKNVEFREWKRREADKLSDPAFRLALQYQLRWLTLTLRASSEKANLTLLAGEAQEILDAIFHDAVKLSSQEQHLGQAVTSTVFAKAYEIGNLGKDKWPLSPVNLDEIYSVVVFPPLRSPGRLETLRSAWIKRIQQEGLKVEAWSGNGGKKNGQSSGPRGPEYEKFVTETVPELQWQMEIDLFRNGDESRAAKRMLDHITKHISHRSARSWGEEFQKLLTPAIAPAAPAPGGTAQAVAPTAP